MKSDFERLICTGNIQFTETIKITDITNNKVLVDCSGVREKFNLFDLRRYTNRTK